MKTTFDKAVSWFRAGIGGDRGSPSDGGNWELFSGYCSDFGTDFAVDDDLALDRKRVGILYADIVDYTRMTEEDEEGTHRKLMQGLEIAKRWILFNEGRIAHVAGDAVLAEFADAASAFQCAIDIQVASRKWNASLNLSSQARFRIGVNYGDVIAERGDIYGNAVNLAARLEKLAFSGGICVSESVRKQLADNSSYRFVALGKRLVRNISEPVEIFWIEVDMSRAAERDTRPATDAISVTP